jgi:hypothetical protein
VLPAGEIPAPLRGGAASPGIESWAREVTNRTKRRQSDARAVTKVKLLSLVKYLTAGRQYRSGWQAPVGTTANGEVAGDCGGVREHGAFGEGSTKGPGRSTVVLIRGQGESSMPDDMDHS